MRGLVVLVVLGALSSVEDLDSFFFEEPEIKEADGISLSLSDDDELSPDSLSDDSRTGFATFLGEGVFLVVAFFGDALAAPTVGFID
jgi:hypothetical protein